MIQLLSCGSRRRRKPRSLFARLLFVGGLLWCVSIFHSFASRSQYLNTGKSSHFSRHLLSTSEWEACDYETKYMRNESDPDNKHTTPVSAYGWMVFHIICIIIIFIAVAIVCDDFFVPSLEAISEKLDLSEDVAGATFMAAGSSAPELFTSVAGVTNDSDVGVGTIVGSAVFNLLAIIALTAALTTQTLQLDWRPLFRDSVCYALSITVFVVFAWDAKFEFYESVILLLLYFLYIFLMKYNVHLMNFLERWGQKAGRVSPEVHGIPDVQTVVDINQRPETGSATEDTEKVPHAKLAPLKVAFEVETKSNACSNHSFVVGHGSLPHFTHSHKGELSSHFRRVSSARNNKLELPLPTPVTTNSEPLLTILFENNLNDGEKTRRKSSAIPHEMVKIKSIAAGHIAKEMRRHSLAERLNVCETSAGEKGEPTVSTEEQEEDGDVNIKIIPCLPTVSISLPEMGEGKAICVYLRYLLDWLLLIPAFPFICLFTWTIPNCSKVNTRKYFLASFFASILWIAILSFGMVTLVGRVGCILNIDKFTMGLVVIAIGTSIPDALSSIIVARDGYGDMAVSNAIGSNVFDIDLGIGLPFVIKGIIQNFDPIYLLSKKDQELYDNDELTIVPHVKFGFILLLILCLCIGVFIFVKFRLGRIVGASFFFLYVVFVTYAYLQDLLCDNDC